MRTLTMLLMLCLLVPVTLVSQQEKTYTLKESQLTEQQRTALQGQQATTTLQTWTGVGKEVGVAMKEGLSALNTEVNKFSESPAGQFTMFIIAYKVIGVDAIQFAIGLPLFFVGLLYFTYIFRRNFVSRTTCTSVKGPLWARERTYATERPLLDSSEAAGYWGAFMVYLAFIAFITFV